MNSDLKTKVFLNVSTGNEIPMLLTVYLGGLSMYRANYDLTSTQKLSQFLATTMDKIDTPNRALKIQIQFWPDICFVCL